jgi:hypothetical protein
MGNHPLQYSTWGGWDRPATGFFGSWGCGCAPAAKAIRSPGLPPPAPGRQSAWKSRCRTSTRRISWVPPRLVISGEPSAPLARFPMAWKRGPPSLNQARRLWLSLPAAAECQREDGCVQEDHRFFRAFL